MSNNKGLFLHFFILPEIISLRRFKGCNLLDLPITATWTRQRRAATNPKTFNFTNKTKIKHMWRRWGTPQNFFLAFIDEFKKQIVIIKMLKWAKNKIILIFTRLHFFKKIKKNICRYHYQNLNMIYSSWDIEQNILKFVILGHFLPFYPLKTPTIKILKNEKIHHFTHVPKIRIYDVRFLRYGVRQANIFVILCHFLPF